MKLLKLIFLFPLTILLFQCTETKRGCLDINAPNFDVDADEPCEDGCCEKTQLSISFIHRYWINDTIANTVRLGVPFNIFPDTNHHIAFNQIYFYITDFQMIKADGTILESSSSKTIETNPPLTIIDNNAFIDRSNVTPQSLGDFTPSDGIEQIRFNVGVTNINNQIIPDSLNFSHPFGWKGDSTNWNDTDGYSSLKMEFLTYKNDTTLLDSVPREIILTSLDVKPITIDSSFDLQIGLNTRISLLMDYNKLFEGIDITNDSSTTIKNHIIENISASILLDNVVQ